MMPNVIMQALNLMMPNVNLQQMQNIQSPDDMAQFLLNSGRVNQNQVNQARQMWSRPDVRQMVQNKFNFKQ